MEASELMIGDWVIGGSGEQFKIGIIDPDFLYWNDIKPIPLTPEILEKNEFTKGGMFGKIYYLAVEDFEISVYFAHVNTQLIIEKRNGKEIINILNVEYLHILQHALNLCGIDKTIEL